MYGAHHGATTAATNATLHPHQAAMLSASGGERRYSRDELARVRREIMGLEE